MNDEFKAKVELIHEIAKKLITHAYDDGQAKGLKPKDRVLALILAAGGGAGALNNSTDIEGKVRHFRVTSNLFSQTLAKAINANGGPSIEVESEYHVEVAGSPDALFAAPAEGGGHGPN